MAKKAKKKTAKKAGKKTAKKAKKKASRRISKARYCGCAPRRKKGAKKSKK